MGGFMIALRCEIHLAKFLVICSIMVHGTALLGQGGWTDGGTTVRLTTSTDNVGLGTSSPLGKLHVSSGTSGDALLYIDADTDNSNEYDNPAIFLRQDGAIVVGTIGLEGFGGNHMSGSVTNGMYIDSKYTSLVLGTKGIVAMTIDGSQRVGIGTNAPSGARLVIQENGSEPGLQIKHGGSNLFATILGPVNRDLRFKLQDNDWPDKFAFLKSDGTNLLSIRRDGVVSLGTVSIPSSFPHKLAVDGSIIAEEVKVELSGTWPDYVFAKDYNLMPLSELDAYIASNGRLPGIPSFDDVAANGLSLGASQALLLKKIEELTLYMIEMKKQNDDLQAVVVELKSRSK